MLFKNSTLLVLFLSWHLSSMAQWNTIYFPSLAATSQLPFLEAVEFINDEQGFASGSLNNFKGPIIVQTEDGGIHWDTVFMDTVQLKGSSFTDLCFTNSNTMHLVAGRWHNNKSYIITSKDLGNNWTTQTINAPGLHKLFFSSVNIGYAIGNKGAFFKTIDGGTTWKDQSLLTTDWLSSLHFTSDDVGYVTSKDKIHKTTDGGDTWVSTDIVTDERNTHIYFSSKNVGYYLSQNETVDNQGNPDSHENVVYKTTDGGDTWNLVSTYPSFNFNSAMQFTDDNTGYIIGFFKLLKTIDGGKTWTKEVSSKPSGGDFMDNANDIFFLDGKGYAVGYGQFYTTKINIVPSSIPELESNGMTLYPNPAQTTLNIQLTKVLGSASFSLFNMNGQLVIQKELPNNPSEVLLPENLENGIYQAVIQQGHKVEIQALSIMK